MRLLSTKTLELVYFASYPPEYAILSHRWEEEEILFEDVSKISLSSPENPARSKLGFAKVMGACALAADDGYEWIWIDSCCIDKSSSAELQESINSMFRWYRKAQVCYAYLSDIADESSGWSKAFEKSQWFTRGWTLQELLAPSNVEFYSADWSPIGTKLCRTELLASITGIETEALEFDWGIIEDNFCAAQKFSWAAHRQVSKAEDTAYCLFGLFNVNMPLLYGEGEEKAFHRLQQAIFKETADHTLFLFAWAPIAQTVPMLANWITRFCRRPDCVACRSHLQCSPSTMPYPDIIRTSILRELSVEDAHYIRIVREGVIIKLPLIRHSFSDEEVDRTLPVKFVAILPLRHRNHDGILFGITLYEVSSHCYTRAFGQPVLLDVNALRVDRIGQGAYTVYNESPGPATTHLLDYMSSSESLVKIAHFEFSSQSFELFNWRCETQHGTLVQTDVKASFPLPEQQDDHSLSTVSFRSMDDQNIVGTIKIWYSKSKVGLNSISLFQGKRSLGRWPMKYTSQPQHYMSIVVPIDENGDRLRVTLRRISIPECTWSSVVGGEFLAFLADCLPTPRTLEYTCQIEARYRLHVTYVPNIPQSEPFRFFCT